MTKVKWRSYLLALAACLFVAGCVGSGSHSDDDRKGGFYGGVSGGMTRTP